LLKVIVIDLKESVSATLCPSLTLVERTRGPSGDRAHEMRQKRLKKKTAISAFILILYRATTISLK
jgi:hypothetical protein